MGNQEMGKRVHTLGDNEKPSTAVYSVISTLKGCSPLEIPPLAETTDPDALDLLLTGDDESAEVSFTYCEYQVTATAEAVRVKE